jgi:hypothetical protein
VWQRSNGERRCERDGPSGDDECCSDPPENVRPSQQWRQVRLNTALLIIENQREQQHANQVASSFHLNEQEAAATVLGDSGEPFEAYLQQLHTAEDDPREARDDNSMGSLRYVDKGKSENGEDECCSDPMENGGPSRWKAHDDSMGNSQYDDKGKSGNEDHDCCSVPIANDIPGQQSRHVRASITREAHEDSMESSEHDVQGKSDNETHGCCSDPIENDPPHRQVRQVRRSTTTNQQQQDYHDVSSFRLCEALYRDGSSVSLTDAAGMKTTIENTNVLISIHGLSATKSSDADIPWIIAGSTDVDLGIRSLPNEDRQQPSGSTAADGEHVRSLPFVSHSLEKVTIHIPHTVLSKEHVDSLHDSTCKRPALLAAALKEAADGDADVIRPVNVSRRIPLVTWGVKELVASNDPPALNKRQIRSSNPLVAKTLSRSMEVKAASTSSPQPPPTQSAAGTKVKGPTHVDLRNSIKKSLRRVDLLYSDLWAMDIDNLYADDDDRRRTQFWCSH